MSKTDGISIHALLAESDRQALHIIHAARNFYPRSPCGERRALTLTGDGRSNFYPRSPCGERQKPRQTRTDTSNFYPRSPCGERHYFACPFCEKCIISIHALLAESDCSCCSVWLLASYFYPRSPCGERLASSVVLSNTIKISIHALLAESDGVCNQKPPQARKFLSTLSLRRATGIITTFAIIAGHFYPRSPCGERRWLRCWQLAARDISIHALLAESDVDEIPYQREIHQFLSTLSLRRATSLFLT